MQMTSAPYRPDDREISAGQRVLRPGGERYDPYFPKPMNADEVIIKNGDVDATLRLMERVVHTYRDDTREIAKELHRGSLQETVRAIWEFLYHNIQYKLDQEGLEQLRRPARSWSERKTGIDCDCFSIFCSCILVNLGIPHYLRVTRYRQPTWQHVYVIIPKNGKNLSAGYWTMDAVLAMANYEKPFKAKKDYRMSLSGINIAVLSGLDDQLHSDPTSVLMGFEEAGTADLGNPAGSARYEHELYKFLLATRQTIAAAPEAYRQSTGGNPSDVIRMLDYAIEYWYTDKRDDALGQLEINEQTINALSGFDAFNAVEISGANEAELYGDDDAYEIAGPGRPGAKKKKPSKFFSGLKKAVKKVKIGKALMRFNPATIAIRNGFLLALRLNIGKMSEKMKLAYATPQQISSLKASPQRVAAAKRAVEKVEKMFTRLGGKAANMRKAILSAKKGRLNGPGQLGVVPLAAGLAAAVPFVKMVLDVLKKSGLSKEGESMELTPDGQGGGVPMDSISEAGIESYQPSPENYPMAEAVSDEGFSGTGSGELGSLMTSAGSFIGGNPGLALALAAGGAYLLYNAVRIQPRQAGLSGIKKRNHHRQQRNPKSAKRNIPVYRLG